MAKVFIPALLHQFTDNVSQIDVEGENVRTIVNNLDINALVGEWGLENLKLKDNVSQFFEIPQI